MPEFLRRRATLLALVSLVLLAGCSSPGLEAYRHETPRLDLFEYFRGTVDGWGIVTDRSGTVIRRFTVVINGTVQGDTLVLDEDFVYSDGSKEKRVWTIVREAPGRYAGTAADVVGRAAGETAGNALRWRYVLAFPSGGRTWNLDFDDWMFLQDERMMLNRAAFSFWGLRMGEVLISFRRR